MSVDAILLLWVGLSILLAPVVGRMLRFSGRDHHDLNWPNT